MSGNTLRMLIDSGSPMLCLAKSSDRSTQNARKSPGTSQKGPCFVRKGIAEAWTQKRMGSSDLFNCCICLFNFKKNDIGPQELFSGKKRQNPKKNEFNKKRFWKSNTTIAHNATSPSETATVKTLKQTETPIEPKTGSNRGQNTAKHFT